MLGSHTDGDKNLPFLSSFRVGDENLLRHHKPVPPDPSRSADSGEAPAGGGDEDGEGHAYRGTASFFFALYSLLLNQESLCSRLYWMNDFFAFVCMYQAGSPFREPLIKFLTRHPSQTVELFMMEATLNDPQWSRMFMVKSLVQHCSYAHFIRRLCLSV